MDEVVKNIVDKYWKKISKKRNVIGYSGKLQPKIIAHKVFPSRKSFRIYVIRKEKVKDLRPRDLVPGILRIGQDYYETDIIEIGLPKALSNKDRRRPICGGISTMHYGFEDDTACTLNGFFKDNQTGTILQASNNHCFSRENKASIGDPVIQPGPYDHGTEKDVTGKLYKYVEIKFSTFSCPIRNFLVKTYRALFGINPKNKVDIAFATVEVPYEIIATYIGKYNGKRYNISEGELVKKTGRTTEYTEGELFDTHWNGYVMYKRGRAFFTDCYYVKGQGFCAGGDSGSPVFDKMNKYIGALFAGSDFGAVVCKLKNIEEEADVTLLTSED